MKPISKSDILAILPLSEMQGALLFNHLRPENDEGLLLVEFTIVGKLHKENFIKAWELIIDHYDILRATVHWEKIKKPLLVVHKQLQPNWTFKDWSDSGEIEQRKHQLRNSVKAEKLELQKAPLLHFYLSDIDEERSFFLWPCHHILLDGWSTSIIIKEVLRVYDELSEGHTPLMDNIPSLKSYTNWRSSKNDIETSAFWKNYLDGVSHNSMFSSEVDLKQNQTSTRQDYMLSEEESLKIKTIAKDLRISLNSLIQSLWGLLVIRYTNSKDVLIGATVSGRSNDFPKMDQIPGMFMNVQPVRYTITPTCVMEDWLTDNQKKLVSVLAKENSTLTEIDQYCDRNLPSPMFDNIVIFENHPWSDLTGKYVSFHNFKGGITSAYPVSMVIVPDGEIQFTLYTKDKYVFDSLSSWIYESWISLIKSFIEQEYDLVNSLVETIPAPQKENEKSEYSQAESTDSYTAPSSEEEMKMTAIWQRFFPDSKIGIHDDFFSLGGTSLMAIRLFATIEQELNIKESATKLLYYPSISSLVANIRKKESDWKFLVPLKSEGTKTPLFCIHGGEGHILFYKGLRAQVNSDRPLFAVQPKGIKGNEPMHESIEAMSADYLTEIRTVQKRGPYYLMFFCYSALVVEMALKLKEAGEEVHLIVVDSTARAIDFKPKLSLRQRLWYYSKRLVTNPLTSIKESVVYRFRRYIEPLFYRWKRNSTVAILANIREQLHENHNKYEWQTFEGDCYLILAEQDHPDLRQEKIVLWEHWCQGNVQTYTNSGNHNTLFETPNIEPLGKIIENIFSSTTGES